MKQIILLLFFVSFINAASLNSDKRQYSTKDSVKITFTGMSAKNKDWVGIYPLGASNAWKNVVAWKWTYDKDSGVLSFKDLPTGTYQARAFYNNSYKTEAHNYFYVHGTTLEASPSASTISIRDLISYGKNNKDWIAIYKQGDSNSWENVIEWRWMKDIEIEHEPEVVAVRFSHSFGGLNLPKGNYEVRLFRNNSFKVNSKIGFTVKGSVVLTQEDASTISFKYRKGTKKDELDWIAFYVKNDSNAWENVIQWAWVKDLKDNKFHYKGKLPILHPTGHQVRFFRNNSFELDSVVAYDAMFDF